MTRPIIGFLAEFTPVLRPADVAPEARAPEPVPDDGEAEAERHEAVLRAMREEGLAEGQRLAEAAATARFHALADDHAAALEAARAQWAATEGAALAASLLSGLAALEATLADALAGIVTPLIEPALRRRTTQELGQALTDLLAGSHGALIEIRGPGDILEPLRAAWAGNPAVVITATDAVDVVVEAGDTTIRSQLQAWSELFEKALLGIA